METICMILCIVFGLAIIGFGTYAFITGNNTTCVLAIVSAILSILSLLIGVSHNSPSESKSIETKTAPTIDTVVVIKNNIADTTYVYKFKK